MNHYLRALLTAMIFAVIALAAHAIIYVLDAASATQLQDSLVKTLSVIGIFLLVGWVIIGLVSLVKK